MIEFKASPLASKHGFSHTTITRRFAKADERRLGSILKSLKIYEE